MTMSSSGIAGIGSARADRANVLFVDDEERILRSLRMLFRPIYNVQITTDGNEAIEIVQRDKIDVVVSDQRMPIMPGVEVLRRVKDVSPRTMRLLLTGYSDLDAVIGSINDGEIFRYVHKPWDPDEFKSTVAKAVEIAKSLDSVKIQSPLSNIDGGREGILVIDGDQRVATTIRQLVTEKFGDQHQVHWSGDLDGAFDILEQQSIAVVISEVQVEGEAITPLLNHLKRHNPKVITLVLTSLRDTSMLVDLINHGQVHRYLPKPVKRGLITASVKAALTRHRAMQAVPELAKRHHVAETKKPESGHFAARLSRFIERIRQVA